MIEYVDRHRQTSCWKCEAGGQLFARVIDDDWAIEEATGPRRADIRSRFGFRANRLAEQREIDKRFTIGLHYVGDWHTHPERTPKPSPTDFASMRDMVAASRHELTCFLMMIIGTEPSTAGLWVSLHRVDGGWQRLTIESGSSIVSSPPSTRRTP